MLDRSIQPRRSVVAKVALPVVGSLLIPALAFAASAPSEPPVRHPAAVVAMPPAGVLTPAVPGIRGSGSGATVPGHYIVVLKNAPSSRGPDTASRTRILALRYEARVAQVYQWSLRGFSAAMSQAQAQRMAADPDVAYVEQDEIVHVADTQEDPASWGLDRVDQPRLPLDQTYSYDRPMPGASPVTAYIIDSGINTSDPDFENRASWGWDFIGNTNRGVDCVGHGTHTAGIVGGATYGVAKAVKLVAVRVFGCDGNATSSSILSGVEWVTENAVKPAVVNLSVDNACKDAAGHTVSCPSGSYASIVAAITSSINSGLTYVISAGNGNINACGNPFAFETTAGAIVVGATTNADAKASYSNWGSCVDLWAPGGDQSAGILSDWAPVGAGSFDPCTNPCERTGTSPAAAFVAGAVAQLLARSGWATKTPFQVKAELLAHMVSTGVVTGLDANSPNKLLYVPPPPIAGGSSIAAAPSQDGRLSLFGVTSAGELLYRTQTSAGSATWSGWMLSRYGGWYSVAADTDRLNRINAVSLRRAPQDIWIREQGGPNVDDKWSAPHRIDGLLNSVAVAASSGGRLELFGTNSQGQVWQSYKHTVSGNGDFAAWVPFGLPDGTPARSVAAELNADGQVEVFALTATGQLWHRWEQTLDAATSFTAWVPLNSSAAGATISIAVARNRDGSLQLFGANNAGQVFTRHAAGGTNNWFDWAPLPDSLQIGVVRSLAAETNADGRVELFAVDLNGKVWHRWQLSPGSIDYSAWVVIPGDPLRP